MKYLKIVTLLLAISLVGCTSEEDSSMDIRISINGQVLFEDGDDFNGDVDGDFTGNGGSGSKTFLWRNNLRTADYNADITSTSSGTFNMEVKVSNGKVVLNRSLRGGTEPDSFSGVTASGSPGIWQVTITLTSFKGDGSFSLSEGD
ncbi:MAG: hypothetical protein CL555_15795 [Algoriphagus sp.]|nr:hypothetical protein [Algoriphagus sp.]